MRFNYKISFLLAKIEFLIHRDTRLLSNEFHLKTEPWIISYVLGITLAKLFGEYRSFFEKWCKQIGITSVMLFIFSSVSDFGNSMHFIGALMAGPLTLILVLSSPLSKAEIPHGSILGKLCKILIHISRFSYSIYLVHLTVLFTIENLTEHPMIFGPISGFVMLFSSIVMVYFVATIFFLLIERPLQLLIKTYLSTD